MRNEQPAWRRGAFHACRQDHRLAHDSILGLGLPADHRQPGIDPYTHGEWIDPVPGKQLGSNDLGCFEDTQPSPYCPFRVVFVSQGRSEYSLEAIPLETGDVPALRLDRHSQTLERPVHNLQHIFWIEMSGNIG